MHNSVPLSDLSRTALRLELNIHGCHPFPWILHTNAQALLHYKDVKDHMEDPFDLSDCDLPPTQ